MRTARGFKKPSYSFGIIPSLATSTIVGCINMSEAEGVSEGGGSDDAGRDEGVSEQTEAALEEAMSGRHSRPVRSG